jgi:hypothetical protein
LRAGKKFNDGLISFGILQGACRGDPQTIPGEAKLLQKCYCVRKVRIMETEKIGMREFRENLAGYLESGKPLAITRHGETLGFYIPAQKRSRKAEVEAMRAAAKELDAMIATWGASEDELMGEYKEIRRAAREKMRKAK